jgi:hypothetical protein
MNNPDTTLGDRIVFHGDLPIAWRPAEQDPTRAELAALNEANGALLRLFSMLDELPVEPADGNPEIQQAFSRLDAKLNLVLDLVGEVLARQMELPPPHQIALSELGVHWLEPQPKALPARAGQKAYIDLYLKPAFPRPLRFFAQVSVNGRTEKGLRFVAQFRGVGEEVQDGLAKLIFRQHRRMIASQRGA